MEETEKMAAVKKAYADIILNSAKEAADRIMASERKAIFFQQDLRYTKDEAVRILIRLKQMMDAKFTETEVASLSQQRRIEELEAQLNEAEEMIVDLRAEMEQVQDQLDKVKNKHAHHLHGPIEDEDLTCENTEHEKKQLISEPFTSCPQYSKCFNSAKQIATANSSFDKFFVDNPNLATIIMKSKEPELYRNRCTQRIRAIERNLLDEKLPPEDIADQYFLTKSESVINWTEQSVGTCTSPSTKNENMDFTKNPDGSEVVCINSIANEDQPVKVHKMPRRKTRYGNQVCTLLKTKSEKLNLVENSSELEKKSPHNHDQAVCILRRSLRKRKVRNLDEIGTSCRSLPDQSTQSCQPSSSLCRCKTYSLKCNMKPGEDWAKIESEAEIKKDMDSISASRMVTADIKTERQSELTENAAINDTELMESTLVKQDGNAAESPKVMTPNLNLEVDNVSLKDADLIETKISQATNGSRFAENKRLLKYTFSRKRKKEALKIVTRSLLSERASLHEEESGGETRFLS